MISDKFKTEDWLISMNARRVGDRNLALGQPFGNVYPIVFAPQARGDRWFLFGFETVKPLIMADCARILQQIGE